MKTKNLILSITIFICNAAVSFAQDGEQLFKTNCASCHTVGKGKLVGPDLRDVQNRHDMQWMQKWIKSSQSLVKAGDAQAVKLFNDNNKIPMPDLAISEDQIKSIVEFITAKSTELSSVKTDLASNTSNTSGNTTSIVVSSDSKKQTVNLLNLFSFTEYLLIGLLCLLLIVIWVLSKTIKSMSLQLADKIDIGK
ncbi:MAG: cytochrome c [Bacteroidetes bacterium]|nr:cytochrome c [Bacteroidota bacterium]